MIDIVFRRNRPIPPVPLCPDHKIEMRLRGKLGRPTRFADQIDEQYTLIYFCPVPDCNHTAEIKQERSQSPDPTEVPPRPAFARRRGTTTNP